MSRKPTTPSYSGVQWADVSQAMESAIADYPNGMIECKLEPNGLGVFTLTVTHWYDCCVSSHASFTSEPWSQSKGRLEAFVYRSIIDTLKESDRQIARCLVVGDVHE